jgi:uncharacterized membrane protein
MIIKVQIIMILTKQQPRQMLIVVWLLVQAIYNIVGQIRDHQVDQEEVVEVIIRIQIVQVMVEVMVVVVVGVVVMVVYMQEIRIAVELEDKE